jgi:hypothetical protein
MRSRQFALTAAAVFLAAACAGPALARQAIEGSGELETRTLDVAAFTKIDLGGAFDVEIGFGQNQQVEVTVDDNLWDNLVADVDGGRLELDWAKNCDPSDRCAIRITMSAPLEEFTLHGAGDVEVEGLAGKRLAFYLRGAGDVELDGTVDALEIMLTGAGDCDARELEAKDVKVSLSGVGNCKVYASESLDAKVSGVGNVTYWGDPERKSTKVSGLGNIDGR